MTAAQSQQRMKISSQQASPSLEGGDKGVGEGI